MSSENQLPKPVLLGDVLSEVCFSDPDIPAIISADQVLDFRTLNQIAMRFQECLENDGVNRNSTVALNSHQTVVIFGFIFACARIGAKLVFASKTLASTKAIRPTHFFKSEDAQGSYQVIFRTIDDGWFSFSTSEHITGHSVDPEVDWLVLNTSGSTGNPKFFSLSQRQIMDRVRTSALDFKPRETRLGFLHKPSARPFVLRALTALLNRCAIVDSKDPEFWYRAGVDRLTASPAQVRPLLGNIALPYKLPRIELPGAEVQPDLLRTLLSSFEVVENAYGSGETGKSYSNEFRLTADGAIRCQGRKTGNRLDIVDENGVVCGPNQVGYVRIQSPSAIKRYCNDVKETESVRADGFYPGDLAAWGENAQLVIQGREDDVINVGGVKVNSKLIEQIIETTNGVRGAVAFKNPKPGRGEEIIAMVVLEEGAHLPTVVENSKDICRQKLGILFAPNVVRPISEIPLTEDGDKHRVRCQQLILERSGKVVDAELVID